VSAQFEIGPTLACPACGVPLVERAQALLCDRCGGRYPVGGGIPRFNPDGFYWGEIPRSQMRAIVERARTGGWEPALRELLAPGRPDLYDYVTDPGRADWRHYLPLDDSADVLDLGAGWGSLTALLAPRCRSVTAVEGVEERMRFLDLRCRQQGLANVVRVRSDLLHLPFLAGSFDVVVMNGVLEWVACADLGPPPEVVQRRFLRRIRRLLRPGGALYLGIENRTGYQLWLGLRDHSGLPFTSLLPRPVANVVTRLVAAGGKRGPYRTYTYTYWGYRRLLRGCGFDEVDVYAPLPGYNTPRYLAPLDRGAPLRFLLRHVARPVHARRLAAVAGHLPLTAARLLVSSFAVFARVGPPC